MRHAAAAVQQKQRQKTAAAQAAGATKLPKNKQPSRYAPAVFAVIVVVIAVMFSLANKETDEQLHERTMRGQLGVRSHDRWHFPSTNISVARRAWNGERYRDLAEWRVPLVLTGSVADSWKARTLWTPEYLMSEFPVVAVQKQHIRDFATFHDGKPLENLLTTIKWKDFNVYSHRSLKSVFGLEQDKAAPPNVTEFHYFTSRLERLEPASRVNFTTHVQPLADLLLSDEYQSNLWCGKAGLVTHSHYDAQYNFFVQLRGRKRFTLLAPHALLPQFSCLHPHYGHLSPAPSPFAAPAASERDVRKFERDGLELTAYVAELGPGDMLIVPPFWWHHVETLETSVSVNVWSTAPEYALIEKVYQAPIPFEENWPKRKMVFAAHRYISELIMRLHALGSIYTVLDAQGKPVPRGGGGAVVCEFMERLVAERWQYLIDHQLIDNNHTKWLMFGNAYNGHCAGGYFVMETAAPNGYFNGDMSFMNRGLDIIVPMFREIHELSLREPPLPTATEIDRRPLGAKAADGGASDKPSAKDAGSAESTGPQPRLQSVERGYWQNDQFAQSVFAETRNHHRQSAAIMHRLLGNYIEHLSNLVLGPDFVYPFLQYCFSR